MHRPRLVILALCFLSAWSAIPATVRGDMVSYSVSTSPSPRPTDFSQALSIPTFNTSLGTLQQVVLSYSNSTDIQGSVTNNSATSQSFTVSEATLFTLTYNSSTLLSNALSASQTYSSLASKATAGFGEFMEPGSAGPATYMSGSTMFQTLQNSVSGSAVSLTFGTLTDTKVVGGGGNITTGIYTNAAATVTVEYIFNPTSSNVPEPASFAMTALGGLLAGSSVMVAKRRNRKKLVG